MQRRRDPEADPFLLPMALLLNGIGIAEISRLDIAEGRMGWDALGVKQIVWSGMAMVIAALCAEGESSIGNIGQIDRGYERIDERLQGLGAGIERADL